MTHTPGGGGLPWVLPPQPRTASPSEREGRPPERAEPYPGVTDRLLTPGGVGGGMVPAGGTGGRVEIRGTCDEKALRAVQKALAKVGARHADLRFRRASPYLMGTVMTTATFDLIEGWQPLVEDDG